MKALRVLLLAVVVAMSGWTFAPDVHGGDCYWVGCAPDGFWFECGVVYPCTNKTVCYHSGCQSEATETWTIDGVPCYGLPPRECGCNCNHEEKCDPYIVPQVTIQSIHDLAYGTEYCWSRDFETVCYYIAQCEQPQQGWCDNLEYPDAMSCVFTEPYDLNLITSAAWKPLFTVCECIPVP